MVQDQLVEYITSQIKAGVSAETIKATLVAAGWQSADVDDTLKKVQPPATPVQPATASMSSPAVTTTTTTTTGASMMGATGPKTISTAKAEPQTIRVSDLVSTSDKTISVSAAKPVDTRAESTKKFLTPVSVPAGATSYQAPTVRSSSSRGPITTEILLGALMIIFGAVAVYFFLANQNLSSQVTNLTAQSTGVSTQVSTLQNQLNASTTALTAEAASATMENQQLALNLSFYVAPIGSTATTTSTTILTGFVSGGNGRSYTITTPYGARVAVANSKDPKVVTLIQPLVGTTTMQFAGTYTPGIDSVTLTVINGVSLIAPPVPAALASTTAPGLPTATPPAGTSTPGQ